MDTITILQNQIVIMKALMAMSELPDYLKIILSKHVEFTEARIRALS